MPHPVLWSRASVCVCLSGAAFAHYGAEPDVTWGHGGDAPSCALLGGFAISARDALLWQHYGNAWQSPAVIRQAHHIHAAHAHYACRQRLPLLAITLMCLLRAPFHFVHTAGVL